MREVKIWVSPRHTDFSDFCQILVILGSPFFSLENITKKSESFQSVLVHMSWAEARGSTTGLYQLSIWVLRNAAIYNDTKNGQGVGCWRPQGCWRLDWRSGWHGKDCKKCWVLWLGLPNSHEVKAAYLSKHGLKSSTISFLPFFSS